MSKSVLDWQIKGNKALSKPPISPVKIHEDILVQILRQLDKRNLSSHK